MSFAFGNRHPCDLVPQCPDRRTEPCDERKRPWVLATAVLGSSLAFLEGSIVGLALPAMQAELLLTSEEVQWISNAYLLVFGALLLFGGALGDRYGVRRVFAGGTIIFVIGALGASFASSVGWLIFWRVVQAIGSAALVPNSLALLSRHFDPETRGRAIGTWAGASALTTAAGPVVGGWLVDTYGWPSVFLSVVPLGVITVVIAAQIPRDENTRRLPLDAAGAVLLTTGLLSLVFAILTTGSLRLTSAVAALLLGAAFFYYERRVANPMLPLALFRNTVFSGANGATALLYAALSGALYFLPFNLIQIQGYSALQAGLALLPISLLLGIGSIVAGDKLQKLSPRHVLTVGPLIAALGYVLLARPGHETHYLTDWLPPIVAIGVGMTLSVAPLTTVVMSAADDARAGVASGTNNTAARLSGMLSIAGLTAVAVGLFEAELAAGLQAAGVPAELSAHFLSRANELAQLSASDLGQPTAQDIVEASYIVVFRQLMLLCAAGAVLSGTVAWLTLRGQHFNRSSGVDGAD